MKIMIDNSENLTYYQYSQINYLWMTQAKSKIPRLSIAL